jgi:hypothetical protein
VKTNEREDETFQVLQKFRGFWGDFSDLNEVVERSETFWVFALVHVDERADFGGRETDVIFSEDDLQFDLQTGEF